MYICKNQADYVVTVVVASCKSSYVINKWRSMLFIQHAMPNLPIACVRLLSVIDQW